MLTKANVRNNSNGHWKMTKYFIYLCSFITVPAVTGIRAGSPWRHLDAGGGEEDGGLNGA